MGKGKRKRRTKAINDRTARQSHSAEKNFSEKIDEKFFFAIRLDLIICLALALITLAVYWQVTNHDFNHFDDEIYVTHNRYVRSGLNAQSIAWAFNFQDKEKLYWQPLTWLSHMLDCQLYGLNPGMHHLTNLIFHIANSLLLFLLFKRMTGEIWKSAFVAALFALHPINVNSVAWVAMRKSLLSTFFWMLTMLSYAYYCKNPQPSRYLLTCLAFALGLLAKPMLVTLPCVLLLLDYWPLRRLHRPTIQSAFGLVKEKAPLFVMSGISIYLSMLSIKGYHNVISFKEVPLTLRISNALVSYVAYMGKMILPQNMAVLYPYPSAVPFWKAACSGVFLVFVSLAVVAIARRRPYLPVGWLWFLGTLVPVSGLIQQGLWPAMADRWAYIPLIGLFVMIAWGIPEIAVRWRYKRQGNCIAAAIALSILAVISARQLRHWKNAITLYDHTLQVTRNNYVIQSNLGLLLAEQGDFSDAIRHCSEALRIKPDYIEAYINLGYAFSKQGKIGDAVRQYSEALRLNPEIAEVHNNLGLILGRQGKITDAIRHFSEAIRIKPGYGNAHNNLGVAFLAQGKMTEAIKEFSEAVRLDPDNAQAKKNLRAVLAKQGKIKLEPER